MASGAGRAGGTGRHAAASGPGRRLLLGFVAVVSAASVAVGTTAVVRSSTPDGQWPRPATVLEVLEARLARSNGVPTKDVALDAFATMLAPVPGGTVIAAGSPGTVSATFAVRGVLAHWADLDGAQRAAVAPHLRAAPGSPPSGGPASAVPSGSPPASWAAPGGPPAALADEVRRIAADMQRRYGIEYPRIEVGYGGPSTAAAAAAVGIGADGQPATGAVAACRILVYDPGVAIYGRFGSAPHHFTSVIAHELVHCFQFRVAGAQVYGYPSWLVEGSAAWGGTLYAQQRHGLTAGSADFVDLPFVDSWWRGYLDRPQVALTGRSYSAIFFFSLVSAGGGDMWALLGQLLRSPQSAAETALRAAGTDRRTVLLALALGTPRDTVFGPPLTGPGLGTYAPFPQVRAVTPGGSDFATVDTESGPAVVHRRLDLGADVELIFVAAAGTGSYLLRPAEIRRNDPRTVLKAVRLSQTRAGAWYCVRERCACDNGARPPPGMQTVPDAVRVHYVLTDRGFAEVTAYTMAEYCRDPATPTPTASPSPSDPGPGDARAICARFTAAVARSLGPSRRTRVDSADELIVQCEVFLRRTVTIDDGIPVSQVVLLRYRIGPGQTNLCRPGGPFPKRPLRGGCWLDHGDGAAFDRGRISVEFQHWTARPANMVNRLADIADAM